MDKSSLEIGIAEIDYTPETGLNLVGNYRGDDYASRGVHDPLFARALVASNAKLEKVALLTIDICKLNRESVENMRNYIASKTDIKTDNILVHATHTHSGPDLDWNIPKTQEYLKKAANVVCLANQRLASTNLYVGSTREERVSFNRRLKCKDDRIHYGLGEN